MMRKTGIAVTSYPPTELETTTGQEPYLRRAVPAEVLGFTDVGDISYHIHQGDGASNVQDAATRFVQEGIVALSPELPLVDTGETLKSRVDRAIFTTLENLKTYRHNPDIVAPKEYAEPTYGTLRRLFTIAPDKVTELFPNVVDLQASLLETVRAVADDSTIEVSVDDAEATVINAQFFKLGADRNSFQQHGAHADRVDRTAVVCLENIGPHGELVVVDNYIERCLQLGLDPDRDFNSNLNAILNSGYKDSLIFKVHPVQAGSIIMLDSTKYHFITAKSLSDVLTGIEANADHDIVFVDEAEREVVGRAIINMAFESAECRRLHEVAQALMDRFDLSQVDTNRDEFFNRLDQAVTYFQGCFNGPEQEKTRLAQLARRAIVTKGTANRLYGREATAGRIDWTAMNLNEMIHGLGLIAPPDTPYL